MRWRLAAWRVWGTGSIWLAGDEQEPAPVQVTVVHVVHVVHHYAPLPGGPRHLPQQRAAIAAAGEDDAGPFPG